MSNAPSGQPARIVVGVVLDPAGRFLVQPRTGDPALAGRWELPGGKVEPEEDDAAALAREVEEETALVVRVGERLLAWCHAYPDRRVELWAYACEEVGGGPPPGWCDRVSAAEYRARPIPAANEPLVTAIERRVAGRPA